MNSGHEQTQAVRTGVLYGPYALSFTTGCTPAIPDFTWMSSLNLTGYVAAAGRGAVVGAGITGRDSRYAYTVGFDNATAQYWVAADANTGAFESGGMKPGTYAMSIYKGELAVWTGTATVTAGGSTSVGTLAITADPSSTAAIWRIGDWDGAPLEFNNGSRLADMHPSDVRMNSWGPVTYTVGSSAASSFPAAQFRGDNTPTTIKFNLTAAQVAAHVVKVGVTSAYAGGRPVVAIGQLDVGRSRRADATGFAERHHRHLSREQHDVHVRRARERLRRRDQHADGHRGERLLGSGHLAQRQLGLRRRRTGSVAWPERVSAR